MEHSDASHMCRANQCTCMPRSENAATMTKPSLQEICVRQTVVVTKLRLMGAQLYDCSPECVACMQLADKALAKRSMRSNMQASTRCRATL